MRGGAVLAALAAASLAACAATGGPRPRTAGPMEGAVEQPFEDLGLVRQKASQVLLQAAAEPYAVGNAGDCAAIAVAIAELDEVLGPDVDAKDKAGESLGVEIVSGALRSALGLPFRGVVRRMSGAEKRDRLRAQAVLAGMVRRGFLKGLALAQACPPR